MPVSGLYDGNSLYRGRSFDDSEPYISNKQTGRARGLPENNLLKSFAADKDKASAVAKIKVVVCSFCFSEYLRVPYHVLLIGSFDFQSK